MSKILITGATGFVGKALCARLRQDGHMLTGSTRAKDKGAGPERVPLYHIPEIGPNTDWLQAVSGAEIVIHLAARVHVMNDHAADPLAEFRLVNTAGTKRLAEQAAAAGVKRFVFISTVKVAGEVSRENGFTEQDPACPEDSYGTSKWEAEQALTKITQTTGMEIVILRPPLVYGPGVKGNFLYLIKAINKGIWLPLSAIKNKRSLIYVGNLADVISAAATHPNAANETFFVSDGAPESTPDLVREIAAALGKKSHLINFPVGLLKFLGLLIGKSAAIDRLCVSLTVNIDRVQSLLDWKPPYTIKNGLAETANWFMSNK